MHIAKPSVSVVVCAAFVSVVGLLGSGGCTSDTKKSHDAGPQGEPCLSPGLTTNDCACPTGIPGHRTCGQNGIWQACECPEPLPDGALCREGQKLLCGRCPGETTERSTVCLAGGTFDCSCGDDAGATLQDASSSHLDDSGSAAQDARR